MNDVDAGLTRDERGLWEKVPCRAGCLLVLGGGGGREAIFFGHKGFGLTGMDFSEQMLAQAGDCAAQRGLDFQGWLGEISQIEAPAGSFDVVWISMFLYSVVLTRRRRVEMLRRIWKTLKPGGYLVCSFHWDPRARLSRKGELFRKALAWLTIGNIGFENGDFLFGTIEFRHAFSSEDELRSEFEEGGFQVVDIEILEGGLRGGAVLSRP
jgi:ubiquinone/menaquinone biosynthesis C-methylase UbiE